MSGATDITETSPTIDFLVRLKKIERHGLTVRDILCLYTIMHKPGINGQDMAHALNIENRSSVVSNIGRLLDLGLIVDDRVRARKAQPNILRITDEGRAVWSEIKP